MAADLDVVELTPDLADDYLALFDGAFADNPAWAGCYCYFHDDTSGLRWDSVGEAAQHRHLRAQRIRSEAARGLLAYQDGRAVGWCNVAPRSEYANLRFAAKAVEDPGSDPAVIMCFVIDPDHRGQGVASTLVRAAIDAARRWGVPWLEGYPADPSSFDDDLPASAQSYTGPFAMFAAAGFREVKDMGDWKVMRHDLHQERGPS